MDPLPEEPGSIRSTRSTVTTWSVGQSPSVIVVLQPNAFVYAWSPHYKAMRFLGRVSRLLQIFGHELLASIYIFRFPNTIKVVFALTVAIRHACNYASMRSLPRCIPRRWIDLRDLVRKEAKAFLERILLQCLLSVLQSKEYALWHKATIVITLSVPCYALSVLCFLFSLYIIYIS